MKYEKGKKVRYEQVIFTNPSTTIALSYEYDATGTKYSDKEANRYITILNKDNKTDTVKGCSEGEQSCMVYSYSYINNATVYFYFDLFGKGEFILLLKSLTLGRDKYINPAKILDVNQLNQGDVMNLFEYEYYD